MNEKRVTPAEVASGGSGVRGGRMARTGSGAWAQAGEARTSDATRVRRSTALSIARGSPVCSAPMGSPRARDEMKIHGQHACRALFARRPQSIVRVYLSADLTRSFGDLLHFCAEKHLQYKLVTPEELEKVTES